MIEEMTNTELEEICGGIHPGALPLMVVIIAKQAKQQQQSQEVTSE